jgi:hypothetical protein
MSRAPTVRRPLRLILVIAGMALLASVFVSPMAKAGDGLQTYWKARVKTEYVKDSSDGDGTCRSIRKKHHWEEERKRKVVNGQTIYDEATGRTRNHRRVNDGFERRPC